MTRIDPTPLPKPELWIAHFIFNELKGYNNVGIFENQSVFPFVPSTSSQTTIDGLRTYIQNTDGDGGSSTISIFKYDTLIRFRAQPFYPIRKEQLVIEFLTDDDYEASRNIESIVTYLLDREDASAQELNAWAAANTSTVGLDDYNIFFHRTKVFKIDERRDVVELESVNLPEFASKIIVEYDYHTQDNPYN